MELQKFCGDAAILGFIESMLEELTDMYSEKKQEIVRLREEGEEVFIEAFQQMIIKENSDYKKSFDEKAEADRLINEIRAEILAARGIDNTSACYLLSVIARSFRNSASVLCNLDRTKIGMISLNLQEEYKHLPILNSEGIYNFSKHLNKLLWLPFPPQYKDPYPKSQSVILDPKLRKKIVDAANVYLDEAVEYQTMMKMELHRQRIIGILFDETKLTGNIVKILEKLERRLALENSSLKLISKKDGFCQDDWQVIRSILLLTAGIHGIIRLALMPQENGSGAISDDFKLELIMGLEGTASPNKSSCLSKYLRDVEEINNLKGLRCAQSSILQKNEKEVRTPKK